VVTEKQATNLQAEVNQLKAELGEVEQRHQELQKDSDDDRHKLKKLHDRMCIMEDDLLKLSWDIKALCAELQSAPTKPIS
ncbi:hypothetical protein B296_00020070, partial [Ensete ventricosum]